MLTVQRGNGNSNERRIKKEIIVHIGMIMIMAIVMLYRRMYTSEYDGKDDNIELRGLSDEKEINGKGYEVNVEKMIVNTQKYLFVQFLKGKTFIGEWKSDSEKWLIGKTNKGRVQVRLSALNDANNNEEVLGLYFKCYEGEFINNWLTVTSFTNFNYLITNSSYINKTSPNTTETISDTTTTTNITNKTNTSSLSQPNITFVSFNNSFITSYETGKIFKRTSFSTSPCNSNISLSFISTVITISMKNNLLNTTKNYTINTIDPSNINITFVSECGFNLTIRSTFNETFSSEFLPKLNMYSFITITISISSMLSSILISYQLNKHPSNTSAISLITICQSFIWHSYCCLSNFIFGINYPSFILRFTIIGALNMLCFSIFDLKFLYTYWKLLSHQMPHNILIRYKFPFYITFYIFFFFSFFILIKAFYDKLYITIVFIMLWLPQIIYNIIKNNKIGLPFIYVLICTIERVALPFYFRGCDNNLFRIKGDGWFVIGWSIYLVMNMMIMGMQVAWGGRFMLPSKMRGIGFDYYKSKEEVIGIGGNIKEAECVICLQKVIGGDDINENQDNSLISGGSEREVLGNEGKEGEKVNTEESLKEFTKGNKDVELKVIADLKYGNDMEYEGKERRDKKSRRKRVEVKLIVNGCKKGFGMCFRFYKVPKNKGKKPYMVTPCGHVFHTECLEGWFECKRECPNCRKEMVDY